MMALGVHIKKRMGDFCLRVDFDTDRGALALLGASGCGKSMTLRCIAGVERPDSGRIVLNGRVLFDSEKKIHLPPQKRGVGMMFQNYALFPNMTVLENIACGLRSGTRLQKHTAAREMAQKLRLGDCIDKKPCQLSGGQQQRTALARILVSRPEALLLDEPFTALDETLKWQLELELSDLLAGFPGDVVYVSHDRGEICRLCQSVCVMDAGKSRAKRETAALFSAPGTVSEARASGCENITKAVRVGERQLFCPSWGITLQTRQAVPPELAAVGIRAREVRQASGGIACGVVRVVEDVACTLAVLQTPGEGLLRMALPRGQSIGNKLCITLPPECLMLLEGD